MTISAKIVAHSKTDYAPDIYTVAVRYPRIIHSEAKTHRVLTIDGEEYEFIQDVSMMDDRDLNRNASSSRAVPIDTIIAQVLDDPAMPVAWGRNQSGMQAGAEIDDPGAAVREWLRARDSAVEHARALAKLGLHKQIVNRVLEPFSHISVIITATEWTNFFDLRCHPAADPTMRAVAEAIAAAMQSSEATKLDHGDWHLPYITTEERASVKDMESLAMMSAARCARVSYLNHDGTRPNVERDIKLAQLLRDESHMSPFEHQAYVGPNVRGSTLQSNLHPEYTQFRKVLERNAYNSKL